MNDTYIQEQKSEKKLSNFYLFKQIRNHKEFNQSDQNFFGLIMEARMEGVQTSIVL